MTCIDIIFSAVPVTADQPPEKKKREYKDMEEKHTGDQHAKVDMNTVSIPFRAESPLRYRQDSIHCYRPV